MNWNTGFAALGLLFAGCIVGDDRCGPNQQVTDSEYVSCECVEGMVLGDDNQCSPCGDFQEVAGGTCVCVDGAVTNTAGDDCEPCEDGQLAVDDVCVDAEES